MKIAVVDNDADFARSVALLLGAHGHDVRTFTCPVEALAELLRTIPDVLLVDFAMPRLSGIELVRALVCRRRAPHATILMSAHTDRIEGMDLEEEGIDAFLPKPLDLHALLRALEQVGHPPAVAEGVPQSHGCLS